mgnify:CR=1 FL=1
MLRLLLWPGGFETEVAMPARQTLDAAMDRLAERLALSFRRSEAKQRGETTARLRKFYGLCQRCGLRPPSGGPMCAECWVDTGEPR